MHANMRINEQDAEGIPFFKLDIGRALGESGNQNMSEEGDILTSMENENEPLIDKQDCRYCMVL